MSSLKNLKILLIPNRVLNYDLIQLEDIKVAFSKFNVDAHIFTLEYSENKIKSFLKDHSFDVIFAINKGKPLGLNKKIRFISWFQDFYYDSDNLLENYDQKDIVYFYASPKSFGVTKNINCFTTTLYPGIEPSSVSANLPNLNSNFNLVNEFQNLEFSICGYMPSTILAPFFDLHFRNYDYKENHFIDEYFLEWSTNLTHKNENKYELDFWKLFMTDLQIIVEANYEPLSGNIDVKFLEYKIKQRIKKNFKYPSSQIFKEWRTFFSTEYPRFLDRLVLARLLSKHSYNFGLFGKEWINILEFKDFSGKHIENQQELFEIYKKTKINLFNNTHGLGMHSKVIEIMANGGFLALPKSKKNSLVSGINEFFEENEHFVTFTKENFEDLINDWLMDTEKRVKVGKNARKTVINEHTWEKRIKKILRDLEK